MTRYFCWFISWVRSALISKAGNNIISEMKKQSDSNLIYKKTSSTWEIWTVEFMASTNWIYAEQHNLQGRFWKDDLLRSNQRNRTMYTSQHCIYYDQHSSFSMPTTEKNQKKVKTQRLNSRLALQTRRRQLRLYLGLNLKVLFFKIFFILKYIKIIFFYFLKIIFYTAHQNNL
jgi:hypothetical protein